MIKLLVWIRALLFVPWVIFLTATLSIPTVIIGLLGFETTAIRFVRLWNSLVLRFFSVDIKVVGQQFVPQPGEPGCLMLFNHQSHFDIPSLYAAAQAPLRFGAKIELFSIPFFGQALRATGMLPIARANRTEVFKVYNEAKKNFENGAIYVLAPEGTRQTLPAIGPFKKGPFIFAVNAQAPILPVVISGAYDILPKKQFLPGLGRWSYRVIVEFMPQIPTAGMNVEQIDEFADQLRDKMIEAFQRGTFALRALSAQD